MYDFKSMIKICFILNISIIHISIFYKHLCFIYININTAKQHDTFHQILLEKLEEHTQNIAITMFTSTLISLASYMNNVNFENMMFDDLFFMMN